MQPIPFHGEISHSRVLGLLSDLQKSHSKQVFIHSPGGTFEFFSALGPPLSRTGFTAIGENVSSAAVVLYLLGHKRYATPDATFFFHEVRAIIGEDLEITVTDVEEAAERAREARLYIEAERRETIEEWHRRMRMAQSWMLDFLRARTDLPTSTFLSLMRGEVTLTAREAVNYGIVHQIVSLDELHSSA